MRATRERNSFFNEYIPKHKSRYRERLRQKANILSGKGYRRIPKPTYYIDSNGELVQEFNSL